MIEPLTCPECETDDATERISQTTNGDTHRQIYACSDCTIQYTVEFEATEKEAQRP